MIKENKWIREKERGREIYLTWPKAKHLSLFYV